MPRLILLCEYPSIHGGEQSMLATLDGVRRAGFSLQVVAPDEGPLATELHRRAIEVISFPFHELDGKRLEQTVLRDRLSDLLRHQKPDLLHANSLAMGRLSGPVAAELGIPSIAHLRDIVRLSKRAIADLNAHSRLLAVSEATRNYHLAQGLSEAKTQVLFNGVNLEQFQPRRATGYLHKELQLPESAKLIAQIGQIGLRKGHDLLAEAACRLRATHADLHYLVVGRRWSEKDESRRFEAKLHELAAGPLAGHLHFLGVRNDIASLMNELTLLVHPARQEPLGRVLLEAAASGVPIIATEVGGTPEIFPLLQATSNPNIASPPVHPAGERATDQEMDPPFQIKRSLTSPDRAARLVPADDVTALVEAMQQLLNGTDERNQIAAAARNRAIEGFDINRATAGLVRHYHQTLRETC